MSTIDLNLTSLRNKADDGSRQGLNIQAYVSLESLTIAMLTSKQYDTSALFSCLCEG